MIISYERVFSTSGEAFDCGDEAAEWFDKFLKKTGLRLYNGQNENLKRRDMKVGNPNWHDTTKDGDEVSNRNLKFVLIVGQSIELWGNTDYNYGRTIQWSGNTGPISI